MKILIIYGTVEGQSRKIARFMEEELQSQGHEVVIADATEEPPSPEGYDGIIVGSSIHMHKYNDAVRDYVMNNQALLNRLPSAFFSVCMAVASDIPEEHEEASEIAKTFIGSTGWNTNEVWHIAGALRYTKYDYFKRLIMRMITKKQGGPTDTSRDYEFTDWGEVKQMVNKFVKKARKKELVD